jgi:hypothetical protein
MQSIDNLIDIELLPENLKTQVLNALSLKKDSQSVQLKKTATFRQSREIIDNKLNQVIDVEKSTYFCLDENKEVQIDKPIIQGLSLDQGEDRVLHTLSLLLYRKSENVDQSSPNYYMGNYQKGIISINEIEMETARIIVSPHEFYSTYLGRDDYNTHHIKFILGKLDKLSKRTFLTAWKFPKETKRKTKTYLFFRTYLQLFQMALLNNDLSEIERDEILSNETLLQGKKCHFLFKFQPQFTSNIREQYVEFPEDIYYRISKVIGKDRFSHSINLMRDFLFREKQQRRFNIIRDKQTLISILKLDKLQEEGRKKIINEKIDESFNVFLKISLITSWKEVIGKHGQTQFQIIINPDFK